MNVQQLWLGQATQAPRISLDYVRHLATSLEQGIRRRAVLNYVAFSVCLLVFGFSVWHALGSRPWMLMPTVFFACSMFFPMYRLRRYVAQQASPADAGVLDTLRFHRQQLERQRDFRRWGWRWGVFAFLLPGAGLKIAAMLAYAFPWIAIAKTVVGAIVGSIFVVAYSEFRARQSQHEIEALDSLAREP